VIREPEQINKTEIRKKRKANQNQNTNCPIRKRE
jgi:hypothetical protein